MTRFGNCAVERASNLRGALWPRLAGPIYASLLISPIDEDAWRLLALLKQKG